ncbi:MAG: hypothetical protein FJZ38_08950 [Candidatus Rokubacteria bacterium]|nr:hypothetical protein [Candidatus Rokubacteria bacterium]
MIRLVTLTVAVALFFAGPLATPRPSVIVGSAIALLLAIAGIVTLWRWALTAAACLFLGAYAGALWLGGAPLDIVGGAWVGVGLVLLNHSAELARLARRSTTDARLIRSQVGGWVAFAAATLGAAFVVTTLARVVAATVPFGGAAPMAGAGALGVVLALALMLLRSSAAR